MWELGHKEGWAPNNWCFQIPVLEKTESSWTARRSNQSILKEINLEYSLEGLMLKLKLQYFDHLMWRANSLEKILMLGKMEARGTIEDEMVGWHNWLNGHEFEWAPGHGKQQGGLACCTSGVCKESDTTEWLNNNNKDISQWSYHTLSNYSDNYVKPWRINQTGIRFLYREILHWIQCSSTYKVLKEWNDKPRISNIVKLYFRFHKGVITPTHLGPDILEHEVRWALGTITMNKASGGDGIPVEFFKS